MDHQRSASFCVKLLMLEDFWINVYDKIINNFFAFSDDSMNFGSFIE